MPQGPPIILGDEARWKFSEISVLCMDKISPNMFSKMCSVVGHSAISILPDKMAEFLRGLAIFGRIYPKIVPNYTKQSQLKNTNSSILVYFSAII